MPLPLAPGVTVLFQGDSITDAGRRREDGASLGDGYARLVADHLTRTHPDAGLRFFNRGINGNTVADLRARWDEDAVALRPGVVSVLAGINETGRRFHQGVVISARSYERDYRHILSRVRDEVGARLLLIEPFLVPARPGQRAWRADLDPRIEVVRRLAEEFGAALLPADALLNEAARRAGGPATIAPDGVHPSPEGHRLLARAWTDLIDLTGLTSA